MRPKRPHALLVSPHCPWTSSGPATLLRLRARMQLMSSFPDKGFIPLRFPAPPAPAVPSDDVSWDRTVADPRMRVEYRMEILSQAACSQEARSQAGKGGREGNQGAIVEQGADRPLFRVTPEDCPELAVCGLSPASACIACHDAYRTMNAPALIGLRRPCVSGLGLTTPWPCPPHLAGEGAVASWLLPRCYTS